MSAPKVTVVAEESPASLAGLRPGDEILTLNGRRPRDVIEYHQLVDEGRVEVAIRRTPKTPRGAASESTEPTQPTEMTLTVDADAGVPIGIEVSSAVFDRVRTCDNHCAFCFIHQLPKGMRKSLYVKDDDYRLSFLYGNFTTLTRFTELDAERVLTERLGPLFVSIHATDPDVRAGMLRNPKGATSLRWLRILLEGGIEVHGQIVVCPGVNDGAILEDTFAGILDEYPDLATAGVVPLGVSDHSHEPTMRTHTLEEARAVCQAVARWQGVYQSVLGRRLAYAADEYYLMADLPMPETPEYDGFPQHENGIGITRAFIESFRGDDSTAFGVRAGFFASVDGAPAEGYRAPRTTFGAAANDRDPRPITILTGTYGAMVLAPLLAEHPRPDVRVLEVENRFFGGNIGVAGLLTGEDLSRVLAEAPTDHRYLLPDACLSSGRFLDGLGLADLPQSVEVIETNGAHLRQVLDAGCR